TLSGGTVTVNNTTLAIGTHTLFAHYVGTTNFAASDSATFTVTITAATAASTTTTLQSSVPAGSVFTQAVTFTATITSGGCTPATCCSSITARRSAVFP